jgi:hypothetical protein
VALRKIECKKKVVLDIGASSGDTAVYFLKRGASVVYTYETDPKKIKAILALNDPRIIFLGQWSGQQPRADVLKMDCEGCESRLSGQGYLMLNRYPQWIIGVHPWVRNRDSLISNLQNAGGSLVRMDGQEELWSNVK